MVSAYGIYSSTGFKNKGAKSSFFTPRCLTKMGREKSGGFIEKSKRPEKPVSGVKR